MNLQVVTEIPTPVRRWKVYPDYKYSGVEWLGKIPEHWQVKRLRHVCSVNPPKSEVGHLPVSTEVSFLPMDAIADNGHLNLEEVRALEVVWQGYTYFREDDVIVAKITPCFENGKGALCKNLVGGIGFGTTELHVLRPGDQVVAPFIFYLTKAHPFRNLGIASMQGAAGQKRVTDDFIKDFSVALPPHWEQKAVADLLDRETAKVDALLAKRQRLIELLQEKRDALITRAVTKGLDPNAPMKNSGVEWLGEIPAHWQVWRLKRLCSLLRDGTHQPPTRTLVGVPLLSVRNIVNGKFVNLSDDSLISEEDFQALERPFSVKKNDILLAIVGATLGKVAVVEQMPPFAIQRSLAVLRPRPSLLEYRFLSYFLQSSVFQRVLWQNVGFSAQPGIYLGTIANLVCVVPPSAEQVLLVKAMDYETRKIDALIPKIREGIEKLKEYRTALISAAVTGKIDVRTEA